MKMKFYIVAIAIVLVIEGAPAAMADEPKMKAEGVIKECAQQVGVAPETLDRIRAGDWTDRSVEAKEMSKCFFSKNGFIDANGNLNDPVMIEKIGAVLGDKQKAEQLIKDCKARENGPKDEIPLSYYKCYLEAKAL